MAEVRRRVLDRRGPALVPETRLVGFEAEPWPPLVSGVRTRRSTCAGRPAETQTPPSSDARIAQPAHDPDERLGRPQPGRTGTPMATMLEERPADVAIDPRIEARRRPWPATSAAAAGAG